MESNYSRPSSLVPQPLLHSVWDGKRHYSSRKRETCAHACSAGPGLTARASEAQPGRWVEETGRKVLGCEGGRTRPQSGPGFACYPLARSAAENSIITAAGERRLGAKNPGSGNFGQRMRARGAPSQTHTHFPPDLESHPKPPQVQVETRRSLPPRPLDPLGSAAFPGCFSASPPVGVQSPTPGLPLAAGSGRAGERSREPASQPTSQPARGGCRPTPAVREAGDTEELAPGRRAARRPPRPGNAQRAIRGRRAAGWSLPTEGRRGSGERGRRRARVQGFANRVGAPPQGCGLGGGAGARECSILLPLRSPAPELQGFIALRAERKAG